MQEQQKYSIYTTILLVLLLVILVVALIIYGRTLLNPSEPVPATAPDTAAMTLDLPEAQRTELRNSVDQLQQQHEAAQAKLNAIQQKLNLQ